MENNLENNQKTALKESTLSELEAEKVQRESAVYHSKSM